MECHYCQVIIFWIWAPSKHNWIESKHLQSDTNVEEAGRGDSTNGSLNQGWAWGPSKARQQLTSAVGGWDHRHRATPATCPPRVRQYPGNSTHRGFSATLSSSRWDAAETLAASTNSSEAQSRANSSVLCCDNCSSSPFSLLLPCLAGCQTEIQGCYRMALVAKTASAPFFQQTKQHTFNF